MKKVKFLTMSVMLFLAASVNVVSAQNIEASGEIYGLKMSIEDNIMNVSFYSTCDDVEDYLRWDGWQFSVATYDGTSPNWNASAFWGSLTWGGDFGDSEELSVNLISEGLYKVNITNVVLHEFYRDKFIKFKVHILRMVDYEWEVSNQLIYYINPQNPDIEPT